MSDGTAPPFFLVGCPRSGTTLLQAQLDAHPEVAVAPETFYARRFLAKPKRYDPATDEGRERLIDDLAATPEFAEMELDRERFAAAVRAAPRDRGAPFRILLEQFRARRGVARVGEKTPNHLLAMPALEALFDGARFVHVVRDARAVALSWRSVPWTNGSLAADAAVWRKYQVAARATPPREGGLLTVRYEELVRSPRDVLERVCRFLDLPFDEAMLRHQEAASVDVEREPWKAGVREAVTASRIDAWREELSPGEIREIEAAVWPELSRAGYVPEHGALRLLPGLARATLARTTKRWRRARKARGGERR